MYQILNIRVNDVVLTGELSIPQNPKALVIFAHGNGSSRFAFRNQYLAAQLNQKGIGTFLLDLLTEGEDKMYDERFNIDNLTDRLLKVMQDLMQNESIANLNVALFGAGTGAAAALIAASIVQGKIRAVVCRGGRPDLALKSLCNLSSPTLLIVGSLDTRVLALNASAMESMNTEKQLAVVPGATHFFEEPETLAIVSSLATNWFETHLDPIGAQVGVR
jgi:putative phosphoribosyl transferase